MRTLKALSFVVVWLGVASGVCAQTDFITAAQAKNHIGQKATVCGRIVGIHFVSSGKGQPTFMHMDERYPDQIFTVVIWGADRLKFGRPEETFLDKDICVTGKITVFLRIPEIVATDPNQIRLRK
jgi:hypothetical protein